ncbi:unnamed protein product [Sphenostylis stenocarpa]|uniref:Uncharacterized protein n=1 Tax=Sphenostylis stenocarpa TaxID=92480 RepID=A0AA86TME0_9FABA|nr:unnamed protein product [Sphenostylis stenocarpa]
MQSAKESRNVTAAVSEWTAEYKRMSKEEARLASEEARAKAAEAAQKRQEQFENSAAGRAARAHQQAMAKKTASSNKGEPVLKVQCSLIKLENGLRLDSLDQLLLGVR